MTKRPAKRVKQIGLHVFIDEDLDGKLDALRGALVAGAYLSRSDTVRHAIHRCWSQMQQQQQKEKL